MWQLLEQTPNPRGTYPEKKETHHSLVKEERERWGKIKPPRSILEIHGPSREDLRSEPSLRIYSLLEDEPRLRYRPSLPLNLAIALILAGPSIFHSIHDRSDQFHNLACPDLTFSVWSGRP